MIITTQEFCTWLKGFVAGSSKYNLTPEGWDLLKDKLNKVVDDPYYKIINDPNTFKVHDLTPIPLEYTQPSIRPYPSCPPPYQVTCNTTEIHPSGTNTVTTQ